MKILKYIAIAAVALLATGCDDFLDVNPDERIEANKMSESQIKAFLVTAYPSANYSWICELSSDNYIDNNAPHRPSGENADKDDSKKSIHYNLNPYDKMDDEIFAFEPAKSYSREADSPTALWEGYYGSMAQVNQILASIDGILQNNPDTTDVLKAAIAECKLIRAYDMFCLVNLFSPVYRSMELSGDSAIAIGVPYIDQPEDKVLVQYERGSVSDAYKHIEEDLTEGLRDISDINMGKQAWRFTPQAAHAFAARFYLFKHEWDKVVEHANAVLGTDYAVLPDKLMNYKVFEGATSSTDYVTQWQHPTLANNIMLLSTSNTLVGRRCAGYRYGFTSTPLTEIWQHWGPINNVYPFPTLFSCGATYYRGGSTDYGFVQMRISEEFEYTNKIAGIGYVHHIRPEFTGNKLLLERAEAYLMLNKLDSCSMDLCAWSDTRLTLPTDAYTAYVETGKIKPLTDALLVNFYKNAKNYNCFTADQWNEWMQAVSDEIPTITAEMMPYMNCLNYSRRYENVQEGYRWFDIKRWGMTVTHVISDGKGGTRTVTLESLDPRRAFEVPQECIGAGLASSIPSVKENEGGNADVRKWEPVFWEKTDE